MTSKGRVDVAAVKADLARMAEEHSLGTPPRRGAAARGAEAAGDGFAEHLIVDVARLNYGKGATNPMESVGFFSRPDAAGESGPRELKAFRIPKDRVSALLPGTFEENTIRVYCRSQDERVIEAARAAFQKWSARYTSSPGMPVSASSSAGTARLAPSALLDADTPLRALPGSTPPGDGSPSRDPSGSAPPTTHAAKRRRGAPYRAILTPVRELPGEAADAAHARSSKRSREAD